MLKRPLISKEELLEKMRVEDERVKAEAARAEAERNDSYRRRREKAMWETGRADDITWLKKRVVVHHDPAALVSGIYFIQAGEHDPIKIGRAKRITSRLSELQCAHWEVLNIRAHIPLSFEATNKAELTLHGHFSAHRMRGEWFAPVEELTSLWMEVDHGTR